MRYYLGKNGMEYTNPEDAVKYGEGLEGYREVIVKEEKITYEKLTGNEAPASPVDHVLPTPVPTEPVKPIAELFNAAPAPVEVQTPSSLEAKIEPPVEKIVATEPVNVAEQQNEYEYANTWLMQLTDEQLKELSKQNRLQGWPKMKRETMLRKLGNVPKKTA